MGQKNIHLALAVNNEGNFEEKHFGDAEKYLIYNWNDGEFIFQKEEINKFKNLDEFPEHGLQKKGNEITGLLKSHGIQVVVSKQFGKNIRIVGKHFIPVIIYNETKEQVFQLLKNHMKWIEEELDNRHEEFKLFTIKNGVLKTTIQK
jgi:predicted Fe-Mo cluster-binding NifX family protein